MTISVPDEQAMIDLGGRLADAASSGLVIYLEGELGAGKTTLVRGYLRGLGYDGPVRSPTFTLLEPYEVGASQVVHLDLYRLADPEELEFLGLRDYLDARCTCLIEWPERGGDFLPPADLRVRIGFADGGRAVELDPVTGAAEPLRSALNKAV